MKGIIFNLLEEIVREEHGEDTWDALLESAGLDGVYTSLGSYPDEELGKIVVAASAALGLEPDVIVKYVGHRAVPLIAARFPTFFESHDNTRSFVLTLNDIIHPEVKKLYPGATTPDFGFDTSDPDFLIMSYQSPRRMCAFAEGMVHGAAEHYGETAHFEHVQCMHDGHAECVFRIRFARAIGSGANIAELKRAA